MRIQIKYRKPHIYWIMGYRKEWIFQIIRRNFGSKYLLIRVLGLQIEFSTRGKDVTYELLNKIRQEDE